MIENNVKIKIHERDLTSPAGAGIDSTDIPFILGCTDNVNAPIVHLCTSVKEFEELYGATPSSIAYGYIADDLGTYEKFPIDPGYVCAKELLSQGMSVVYGLWVCRTGDLCEVELKIVSAETADSCYVTVKFSDDVYGIRVTDKNCPSYFFDETKNELRIDCKVSTAYKSFSFKFIPIFDSDEFSMSIEKSSSQIMSIVPDLVSSFSAAVPFLGGGSDDPTYTPPEDEGEDEGSSGPFLQGSNMNYVMLLTEEGTNNYSVRKTTSDQDSLTFTASDALDAASDVSVHSVKYLCSGSFPSILVGDKDACSLPVSEGDLCAKLISTAKSRGDCVALIDCVTVSDDVTPTDVYSFTDSLLKSIDTEGYGTFMYPVASYYCPTVGDKIPMPASFGYLMCLAKAIKTSPNWLAMAGVTRGRVPNISQLIVPNGVISNKVAEDMQPRLGDETHHISINCITDVKPYGLTLWGNRTLKAVDPEGLVAMNFLNVRNMVSDIKKLLYTSAKSLMFEQNSDTLWIRFKGKISPLLEQLKGGNAISDYKLIKTNVTKDGSPVQKGEIAAVIRIYPIYAVEYFDLTVEISDQDVTVSGQ